MDAHVGVIRSRHPARAETVLTPSMTRGRKPHTSQTLQQKHTRTHTVGKSYTFTYSCVDLIWQSWNAVLWLLLYPRGMLHSLICDPDPDPQSYACYRLAYLNGRTDVFVSIPDPFFARDITTVSISSWVMAGIILLQFWLVVSFIFILLSSLLFLVSPSFAISFENRKAPSHKQP